MKLLKLINLYNNKVQDNKIKLQNKLKLQNNKINLMIKEEIVHLKNKPLFLNNE